MDIWHLHNQVRGEQMSAIIIINFLFKKKSLQKNWLMYDSLNFSTCIDSYP